jgi:hypothetical protein
MGSNQGGENGNEPLAAFRQNHPHVSAAALQQAGRETPPEESNVAARAQDSQYAPENNKIDGYCGSKIHQKNGAMYLLPGHQTTMIPTMSGNLVPNPSSTTAVGGTNAVGNVDFSQVAFPFTYPPSDAVATLTVIPSNGRRRANKKVADVLRSHQVPTKSHKAQPSASTGQFTSMYRGVTRHRLTGRYEAHFWDSSYKRENVVGGSWKIYLSSAAVESFSVCIMPAALPLTLPIPTIVLQGKNKRSRGRQVYLGGYSDEEAAARTYDRAAIAFLGKKACTNVS